jgi:hypothetical protein
LQMVRIGRQIPHFEAVELQSIEAVFSADMCYRYLLSMNYSDTLLDSGRSRSAAVILKNPSAADEQMADATIRKVETFIYHRFADVRQLHILNIFAFRATEPGDLNSAFRAEGALKVIGPENDHVIKTVAEGCDYVVLAWGNNSGIDRDLYDERVFRVKQLLQECPQQKIFCVSGKRQTKEPLHGLMWGYAYAIGPAVEQMKGI